MEGVATWIIAQEYTEPGEVTVDSFWGLDAEATQA